MFGGFSFSIGGMQLAAIVVTCSAIVFVVAAMRLLLKILRHSEEGGAELQKLLAVIQEEIRCFRQFSVGANALIDRSTATLAGVEPRLDALCSEVIGKLGAVLVPPSPELLAFTQDGLDVIQKVADVPSENLVKWRLEHRAELDRLLYQKKRIEAELVELRGRYHQSECQVIELRRQVLSSTEAGSAAEQLRSQNQRLVGDLREARRRALEAERTIAPLTQELQQAKARLSLQSGATPEKGDTTELIAANAVLHGRILELEALSLQLQEKVQGSEEELARTLREKSFIEERFVQDEEAPNHGR